MKHATMDIVIAMITSVVLKLPDAVVSGVVNSTLMLMVGVL